MVAVAVAKAEGQVVYVSTIEIMVSYIASGPALFASQCCRLLCYGRWETHATKGNG